MSWSITTYGMASIHNFADAKEWFTGRNKPKSAKWKDHQRPLDTDHMYHKRIEQHKTERGIAYQMILYDTPLVTYFEDGAVEMRLHDSASAYLFSWRVRPTDANMGRIHGQTYLRVRRPQNDYDYLKGERIMLKPKGVGWEVISGAKQRQRKELDRKAAREAAKMLKPFFMWYDASVKLGVKMAQWRHPADVRHLIARGTGALAEPENFDILASYGDNKPALRRMLYENLDLYTKRDVPNSTYPSKTLECL